MVVAQGEGHTAHSSCYLALARPPLVVVVPVVGSRYTHYPAVVVVSSHSHYPPHI